MAKKYYCFALELQATNAVLWAKLVKVWIFLENEKFPTFNIPLFCTQCMEKMEATSKQPLTAEDQQLLGLARSRAATDKAEQ